MSPAFDEMAPSIRGRPVRGAALLSLEYAADLLIFNAQWVSSAGHYPAKLLHFGDSLSIRRRYRSAG
jgi:hypothetical protein